MGVAWPAVALVARRELRRGWRASLAVGLVAGLVIGSTAGAAAVARRTATAQQRLAAAAHIDDVRILALGSVAPVEQITARPEVARSWVANYAIGQVLGRGVTFAGVVASADPHPDLFTPVVVAGRPADDGRADEVVFNEDLARVAGVRVGDHLPMKMLSPAEVSQFDTGFGEPDGPRVDFVVVGLFRPFGTADQQSPILATPAFARQFGDSVTAGRFAFLRLRRGARDVPAVRAAVDQVNAATPRAAGAEEFAPLDLRSPREGSDQVAATARVLTGGLAVFAAVVLIAGLLAVAQGLSRTAAGGAEAQRVEATIGLTTAERVLARCVPAVIGCVVAGVVAGVVVVAAGAVEPLGRLRRIEPHPGVAPNVAVVAVAGMAAMAVLLGGTAWAARRVLRRRPALAAPAAVRSTFPVVRPVAALVGLRLAVDRGSGRREAMRSSFAAVLSITALVAALTFSSSLDRLVHTPSRWGWNGDALVVDTRPDDVQALAADPQLNAVTAFDAATAAVGGRPVSVYAARPVVGRVSWTTVAGRLPAATATDEIVLGTRVARRLDARIGGRVRIGGRWFRVVGVGLGPTLNGERIGDDVLMAPGALAAVSSTAPFHETLVRVAHATDRDAVVQRLGREHEVTPRTPPSDVGNLGQLARLPEALAAVLVLIAVVALVHAVMVIARRRRSDFAVMRALGLSRTTTANAVIVIVMAIVGAGVLVGVPLGVAAARLLWWTVADATAVATDVSIPVARLALLLAGGLVIAALVASLPARRATRRRPAAVLRAE